MAAGGAIYITLSGMCRALGLGTQAQFQRIQRTPTLLKGLRVMPLETRGGLQAVNCLRVDKVALWLAGVETARVKPQFRAKIEAYQEELAPVATQVFLRVAGLSTAQLVPTPADPQVAALAEQIDTLTSVVAFLREHMEAVLEASGQVSGFSLRLDQAIGLLESLAERQETVQEATEARLTETQAQLARIDKRTQRLTPAHARAAQEMVDRMVRETKHLPVPLTYATIYGRLKHRFRAGSNKEIADGRFDDLMAFLRDELSRATSGKAAEQAPLF